MGKPGSARRFLTQIATACPSSTGSASAFFNKEDRALITHLLALDRSGIDPEEARKIDVRICAAFGLQLSAVTAAIDAAKKDGTAAAVVRQQDQTAVDNASSTHNASSSLTDDIPFDGMGEMD